VSAWLKRFGLHLAAAIGATSIFVAAAAVGANQTRQQGAALAPPVELTASPTPRPRRRPTVAVVATPTGASEATHPQTSTGPGPTQVAPLPTPAQTNPTPAQAGPTPVPPGATAAQPSQDDAPPEPADVGPEQSGSPPAAVPPPAGAQPALATAAPAAPNQPASKPTQPRRTPTPATAPVAPAAPAPAPAPAPEKVAPERSLAGTITEILPDGLNVLGVGGRDWHVTPAPGALIRLNGKAARLDALHVGDTVVILGQAQAREGAVFGFLSHAITARRK
jgi:hypothetical protein